jgi:membrane peptidoglycan carboxypeptidase
VGWDLPMSGKTGTTESNRSAGFLGFTNQYAAANYIFDDSNNPSGICSFPLRKCGGGNLFGGNEPARTWFAAMKPIARDFGEVHLPPTDPRYVEGTSGSRVPSVSGLKVDAARQRLKEAGFQVAEQTTPVNSHSSFGTVVGTSPSGQTIPGSIITIMVSNGVPPAPPPPPPPPPGEPPPPAPPTVGMTVVEIPGLPPITVPLLGPPPPPPPAEPAPPPLAAPPPPPLAPPPPPP